MIAAPGATAVTKPVALTVTLPLLDTHALETAGVPEPVSCEVKPTQMVKLPEIVGSGLTVTVAVIWHPFELV
jgi:hypothetical protein